MDALPQTLVDPDLSLRGTGVGSWADYDDRMWMIYRLFEQLHVDPLIRQPASDADDRPVIAPDPAVQPDDLPSFLESYVAAWWHGADPATVAAWSSPKAVADLSTLAAHPSAASWTHYQIHFAVPQCEMSEDGVGGCSLSLLKANGHGTPVEINYRMISFETGELQVTGLSLP